MPLDPAFHQPRRSDRTRAGASIGKVCATASLLFAVAACSIPLRRDEGFGGVEVQRIGGFVELKTRIRDEERRPKDDRETEYEKETIFWENVQLEADGFIYHPNLIEFSASGLFGLVQSSFDTSVGGRQQKNSDNGTTLEYDLSADIIAQSKYPLHLFTRRLQELVPRPFSASQEQTTTESGLIWSYLDEIWPANLQVVTSELDIDPIGDFDRPRNKQTDVVHLDVGHKFSDRHRIRLDYEHQTVKESPFDINYDIDELRLMDVFEFGANKEHRLETSLSTYDQRGTFELQRRELRGALRLTHSDTLRSWYQVEVSDRTQGGIDGGDVKDRTYYVEGNVEHRLYESLVTQVGGLYELQDLGDDGEASRYGLYTTLDYRKKNPWGVLAANYTIEQQRSQRNGEDRVILVIDQRRTFVDPDPIVLSDPQIDKDSIVITDLTGLQVYKEDIDYRLFEFADRIEIHRIPTGDIADGEIVLLDYDIRNVNDITIDTLYQRFGIRQIFDFGLTPYYRYEWQDQTVTGRGTALTQADDVSAHIIGVEYLDRSFRAMVEYENRDSTLAPFEAYSASGGYTHRFANGATGSVGAQWKNTTWFDPIDRERTYFAFDSTYRHSITDSLRLESELRYLNEQDTISGDDQGLGFSLSLEWFYRQLEMRLAFDAGRYDSPFAQTDSAMLTVQVKRRF